MSKSRPRKPARRRAAPIPGNPPTISLCVIARNEESFIGDCLASARPFVDEIVVLDTGSTDGTCEIAYAHGARVGLFEWSDDFAAARNAAIDMATGDWILMLDADERLQPASGPLLRAFVESKPSGPLFYGVRIENREGDGPEDFRVSSVNRLFQARPDLRYAGAIHEDLVYPPDPARARGWPLDFVRITHLGYMPDVVEARDKFDRNRRLLVRETIARPGDPLPWYYLGVDRLFASQPGEAAEFLRRSLACSQNRSTWSRVDTYTQLIVAYSRLCDAVRLEAIVEEAETAGALSPGARWLVAQGLLERGLLLEAERHLLTALEPHQPMDTVHKTGIDGWITRMVLARLYEDTGKPRAALQQVDSALLDPELHERGEVADVGVRLAVLVGDMPGLWRSLEFLPTPAEDDLTGHLRMLELRSIAGPPSRASHVFSAIDRSIGRGDWQSAYVMALNLPGQTMAAAARILFVGARLQTEGAAQAALNLLMHLYEAQPELPELHALLIPVLTGLGRYDDALAANQILQRLQAAAEPTLAA